jgi:predicted ATPase
VVFCTGEAGVGKTSLVRRFCQGLRGTRAVWGGCDPLATSAPLAPFLEAAGELGGVALELGDRDARPYEVARALLDDLARERRSMLVLEDLHWANAGTIDALTYLARRVERAPTLVIGTYRDDELDPAHPLWTMLGRLATAPGVRRLRVERLSRAGVEQLAGRAGRDGEAVYAATRGNPFFVSEMLAAPAGMLSPTPRDAVLARPRLWVSGREACSRWWLRFRLRPSCGCSNWCPGTALTASSAV